MCGIAGIVYPPGQPGQREEIEAATQTLRHRGPDAHGCFVSDNIALGHRRLSIIDTAEAASQPMFNEDQTVCVVFNGEIYNYRSLAAELRDYGHQFRTQSDTEVIVHAWEQWGEACVDRFRGMFALAVYESHHRRLFLARDRLGKKPLYYALEAGRFVFGSEIKAMRGLLGPSLEIDCQGLGEFMTYGYTVGARSIYSGIRRLEPAHVLSIDCGTPIQELSPRRYWDACYAPDDRPAEAEWLEQIDAAISQSVQLRLRSDVPLGAFLSGGLDSSLVVAYMAKLSSTPVRTFTIGFHESSHDESRYAMAVAKHLGVEHHVEHVQPDAVGVLETLVQAYDEPFGDESAIPTYYLCQSTRPHVTVALSGDGGDETFLGYRRYALSRWMLRAGSLMTPLGRYALGRCARRLPLANRFRRLMERQSLAGFGLYHHAMGYSPDMLELLRRDVRDELNRSDEQKMVLDYERCLHGASRAARGRAARDVVQCFGDVDLRNYLPDDILVKVDRASMQHSLEVRCPLLDHSLVELCCRIPERHKLRWFRGKRLIRKLLRRFLPSELIERPKMGFGVPLAHWFRGDLKPLLDDMLNDHDAAAWNWLDRDAVAARVAAHQTGRVNLQAALWRCLFFYRWSTHNQADAENVRHRRALPQVASLDGATTVG